MSFILRKGIIAKEETKERVLGCCDFLESRGFTTSSAAVKQTCCQKFTSAQEGGARLAARPATRGLCSPGNEAAGAAPGAPLSPAGRDTGWRAGGALSRLGRCPIPGRPEAAATALRPPREAAALVPRARRKRQTSVGVFCGLPEREGAVSLLSRPPVPISPPWELRRAPEGSESSAAPSTQGRCGAGAAPAPGAKILCSLHLGALFDLMSCLGRALTVVVPVRKIRVIVRCSPHTFLTIVITKLIADRKTDVKTS